MASLAQQLAVVLLLAQAPTATGEGQGLITCTAGHFIQGGRATLSCHYPPDKHAKNYQYTIRFYPFGSSKGNEEILYCAKIDKCSPTKGFDWNTLIYTNDTLTIHADNITEKSAGTYYCQLVPPNGFQLKNCTVEVTQQVTQQVARREYPATEVPTRSLETATQEEENTNGWKTAIVLVVLFALCVFVVIIVLRHRKGNSFNCRRKDKSWFDKWARNQNLPRNLRRQLEKNDLTGAKTLLLMNEGDIKKLKLSEGGRTLLIRALRDLPGNREDAFDFEEWAEECRLSGGAIRTLKQESLDRLYTLTECSEQTLQGLKLRMIDVIRLRDGLQELRGWNPSSKRIDVSLVTKDTGLKEVVTPNESDPLITQEAAHSSLASVQVITQHPNQQPPGGEESHPTSQNCQKVHESGTQTSPCHVGGRVTSDPAPGRSNSGQNISGSRPACSSEVHSSRGRRKDAQPALTVSPESAQKLECKRIIKEPCPDDETRESGEEDSESAESDTGRKLENDVSLSQRQRHLDSTTSSFGAAGSNTRDMASEDEGTPLKDAVLRDTKEQIGVPQPDSETQTQNRIAGNKPLQANDETHSAASSQALSYYSSNKIRQTPPGSVPPSEDADDKPVDQNRPSSIASVASPRQDEIHSSQRSSTHDAPRMQRNGRPLGSKVVEKIEELRALGVDTGTKRQGQATQQTQLRIRPPNSSEVIH